MLLTVRETAERLRVSARTVEREIAAGRLACVRVRSRLLVTRFAGCMGLGWDKPPA